MWIDTPNARIELAARRALRLRGACGTLLKAVAGTVWITIDNDRRDIVLSAGQSFRIDSREPVVATPMGECATLDLCGAPAAAPPIYRVAWWGA